MSALVVLSQMVPTAPWIWLSLIILAGILCFAWIYVRYEAKGRRSPDGEQELRHEQQQRRTTGAPYSPEGRDREMRARKEPRQGQQT